MALTHSFTFSILRCNISFFIVYPFMTPYIFTAISYAQKSLWTIDGPEAFLFALPVMFGTDTGNRKASKNSRKYRPEVLFLDDSSWPASLRVQKLSP